MRKRRRIEVFNSDGSRDIRTGFQQSVNELCSVIDEYKRELVEAQREIHRLKYTGNIAKTMHMMRMVAPPNNQLTEWPHE